MVLNFRFWDEPLFSKIKVPHHFSNQNEGCGNVPDTPGTQKTLPTGFLDIADSRFRQNTSDTNNLFSVVRRCMRVGFCQGAREFCQGHGGAPECLKARLSFRFRFLCTTTSGGGAGFGGSGGTAPSSSRPAICPLNTKHNGIPNCGPGGFVVYRPTRKPVWSVFWVSGVSGTFPQPSF